MDRFTNRGCTLVLAGDQDELVEVAVERRVSAHGYQHARELPELVRQALKLGVSR